MTSQLDDRTPQERKRQPSLQELAARRHQATGIGRLGRFRSWQTVLVGILALGLLAAWMMSTR